MEKSCPLSEGHSQYWAFVSELTLFMHCRPQRLRCFWSADFPSLCACSESSLTNLIGSSLNLLCLQSHSEPESHWTYPVVMILGADRKERDLLGRECLAREMWIDVIHYEPHILSLRLLNFFSTVFLFLERQSCFVKLYQKERSIELHTHNGGCHETLKLLHISDVLHESKKKVNKLLRVRSTDWK